MFRCLPVEAPTARSWGCPCRSPAFARLTARLGARVSRRGFVLGTAAALALGPGTGSARVPPAPAAPVAFTNLRLFDGASGGLREGLRVVVEGPRIRAVEPAGPPLAPGVQAIDCGGRTLMPGLIDAHWHAMLAAVPLPVVMTADAGYLALLAAQEAERTLLRGVTSVRDMAGPSFGLKRAIDGGVVPGPRIWPSGAMISQTSGHGDFRQPHEVPAAPAAPLSRGVRRELKAHKLHTSPVLIEGAVEDAPAVTVGLATAVARGGMTTAAGGSGWRSATARYTGSPSYAPSAMTCRSGCMPG